MLNVKEISDRWEKEEPIYSDLGNKVIKFIKSEIPAYEILPEITFRTKEILSIVKKIKKKEKEKEYSYDHLSDKLGIRIICSFNEDLNKIDTLINSSFLVKKSEKKKDELDFDRLDYTSNHYDVTLNTSVPQFKGCPHLKDLVFEIQVRTLNQHAWSTVSHGLTYKNEAEISPIMKRRVYRLLSLYEIADDEFAAVNMALINQPDNLLYSLLRKLESKTFKYAKIDYDRATSLHSIKTLLTYFNSNEQNQISSEIENFVIAHDKKIKNIFDENQNRFLEITLLTQPEVFIVWYCLEKFQFTIEDNWGNDFDNNELEQIQALWGKEIK